MDMKTNQQTANQPIPEGYRQNARGDLVPEDRIKDIDKLRDEVVLGVVAAAQALRNDMASFKLEAMGRLGDFIDLSAAEYGVSYGGKKGNVTLTSFDGRYRIVRAIGEHRIFDERIQAAKALIDECLRNWSVGADSRLITIVEGSFRVNKQGYIDVNQVLGLRQFNIDDPLWKQAMEAIADAIQVTGTSQYLNIYERQDDGRYQLLPLAISKL